MMNVPPGGGPHKDRRRVVATLDQPEWRKQSVGRRNAEPITSLHGADRFAARFWQGADELVRAGLPLDADGVA